MSFTLITAVFTDHVREVCSSHSHNDYGERQLGGCHNAIHSATHVRYDTILQIQQRISHAQCASVLQIGTMYVYMYMYNRCAH